MKALTLWQPWAQLVALGLKAIETRSWGTRYRGPLAIQAAAAFPPEAVALCGSGLFKESLAKAGYVDPLGLPRGAVVAVVRLVDCRRITDADQAPSVRELVFGNYSVGRYMWYLRDPVRLTSPVPARGRLGLWDWEPPAGVWVPDLDELCAHWASCAEHERCGPYCSDPRAIAAWREVRTDASGS